MHIPGIFKTDKFAEDDAALVHNMRAMLPADEALREEERRAYIALSMYKAAARVSLARASVVAPFWATFLYTRALKRYVAKFLPLVVNQETQTS